MAVLMEQELYTIVPLNALGPMYEACAATRSLFISL